MYTRRLLWGARDGKADENRDGIVTMEELHRYVLEESEEYCKRYSDDCRLGLTPQVQVASGRLEVPAFGNAYVSLPRNATLAKDILVRPSSSIDIEEGRSNVRLRIDPGSNLVLGTNLDIIVESDRKGYLVLLDINAAGELVQIFPNEGSLRSGVSSLIRPGEPVRLPGEKAGFRFRATPPVGSGLLVAVVTQKNDRVWELASRHKDLTVVPSPAAYLVEIGEALRAGSSVPNNARGSGWSVATLQYKIAFICFGPEISHQMMRDDMKFQKAAVECRSSFTVLVGIFCFLVIVQYIPLVAYAEGSGEMRDSIRKLTEPVIRSVRSATRPTHKTTHDDAGLVKDTPEDDSRKKGVSSTSDRNQSSDAQ